MEGRPPWIGSRCRAESSAKRQSEQHRAFTDALDRATIDIQKRVWTDLKKLPASIEKPDSPRELKVIRFKSLANPAPTAALRVLSKRIINVDRLRFSAESFRVTGVKRFAKAEALCAAHRAGPAPVLDLGCGRGEFLEAAREAGRGASGFDQSEECVNLCRSKGLHAEKADLFAYLDGLADQSLGGIYCSQVVEHIDPHRLPDLIFLMAKAAGHAAGGDRNAESGMPGDFRDALFLDPTHTRPGASTWLLDLYGGGWFRTNRVSGETPPSIHAPSLAELSCGAGAGAVFLGLDYVPFLTEAGDPAQNKAVAAAECRYFAVMCGARTYKVYRRYSSRHLCPERWKAVGVALHASR